MKRLANALWGGVHAALLRWLCNIVLLVHSRIVEEVITIPNYIINQVRFSGDESRIAELMDFIKPDKNESSEHSAVIDFNKIIPMPESLNVDAGSMEVPCLSAILTAINPITDDFGEKKLQPDEFREIVSKVNAFYSHSKPNVMAANVNRQALEKGRIYLDNIMNYGAPTWYEWRVKAWGCKWEASNQEAVSSDTIEFTTPWSAPVPLLQALSEKFPDITISSRWADEDVGVNTGEAEFKVGEILELTRFEVHSKEAFELTAELWGLDLAEEGFAFNEKTQTYEYHDSEEAPNISPTM